MCIAKMRRKTPHLTQNIPVNKTDSLSVGWHDPASPHLVGVAGYLLSHKALFHCALCRSLHPVTMRDGNTSFGEHPGELEICKQRNCPQRLVAHHVSTQWSTFTRWCKSEALLFRLSVCVASISLLCHSDPSTCQHVAHQMWSKAIGLPVFFSERRCLLP